MSPRAWEYGFPLSIASIDARSSCSASTRSARRSRSFPRWVPTVLRHAPWKAVRAAFTALSMSSSVAADTAVITLSVLFVIVGLALHPLMSGFSKIYSKNTHAGLMLSMVPESEAAVHSLLMKRPVG